MIPDIFSFGPLTIRSYGIMLAVAFILAFLVTVKRGQKLGYDSKLIADLALTVSISAIVISRAFYVFSHWDMYSSNPLGIFAIWQGGLTQYGGLVGGALAGILFVRIKKISFNTISDICAPALALGIGIGRIGCFLKGCCFGLPAPNCPIAVSFRPDSLAGAVFGTLPLVPTQIFASLAALAIFASTYKVLVWRGRPGALFWLFVLLHSSARFVISFFRYWEPSSVLMTIGSLEVTLVRLLSVIFMVVSAVVLVTKFSGPPQDVGDTRRPEHP
jgi:phosphatidylglycerol:prolipoprotein diacylglycerol transferase